MGAAAKPFLNIVIRALFQMGARPHKELAGMALSQTLGSNPYLSDSDRNEWLLMFVKSSETLKQNKTVVALLSAAPEGVGTSNHCGVLCVAWTIFATTSVRQRLKHLQERASYSSLH